MNITLTYTYQSSFYPYNFTLLLTLAIHTLYGGVACASTATSVSSIRGLVIYQSFSGDLSPNSAEHYSAIYYQKLFSLSIAGRWYIWSNRYSTALFLLVTSVGWRGGTEATRATDTDSLLAETGRVILTSLTAETGRTSSIFCLHKENEFCQPTARITISSVSKTKGIRVGYYVLDI